MTIPEGSFFCHLRGETDLASLADLWVRSWQETMPQIDFEARRAWFLDHMQGLEAAGYLTLCGFDAARQLLGFASLHPTAHHLEQLAVAPQAWGGGAAAFLLAEARRLSPREMILDVNADNARAVRFYEREGFQRIGESVNPISGLKTWRMRWQAS